MSTNERIHEVESLIEAQRSLIRCTNSDLENPARVEREIERLEARIKLDTTQVNILRERLADGPALLRQYRGRLLELAKELKLLENAKAIEKLQELAVAMRELNQ